MTWDFLQGRSIASAAMAGDVHDAGAALRTRFERALQRRESGI